jgi:hypothetical protein
VVGRGPRRRREGRHCARRPARPRWSLIAEPGYSGGWRVRIGSRCA